MSPAAVGRAVVITGASSGIGLATALQLARRHDRLLLLARDAGALARAAELCRDAGAAEVHHLATDVARSPDVVAAFAEADHTLGTIDAVVHSATVMAYGRMEDLPDEVFRTVVDTAVHGTADLARAALARFRAAGRGTLIVVNSLLGSVTVPYMGAYATAKWGQRAVVRTLQQEVRDAPGIHVCLASPGSMNTPIYYQAANYVGKSARPPIPVLQPERAGAVIASLLDRPRRHVSVPIGPTNPVIITGFRLMPRLYDLLVGPLFRLAALTRADQPATTGNVHDAVAAAEELHGNWPDERST